MMFWMYWFLIGIGTCDLLDEALTQIAELKVIIARLEDELSLCREGQSEFKCVCVWIP